MNVLVNGIGNIGTTLLNLLVRYRVPLGVNNIYALKNSEVNSWQKAELQLLKDQGVEVVLKKQLSNSDLKELIESIDFVFDCMSNGFGIRNKEWYSNFPNLKGAVAQGSENGFGIPFIEGFNTAEVKGQKFVQVVSCNTHGIVGLLNLFLKDQYKDLESADFVVVRRSEDIAYHERMVSGNVIARHLDDQLGTHHAIDAMRLFKTKGLSLNIKSSDITTPSQYMHSLRYSLKLKEAFDFKKIESRITGCKMISKTKKFDSNAVFELGRRYGFQGRLFSHLIMVTNNILFTNDGRDVSGWAFIPQEGNTIISTLAAFLFQTNNPGAEDILSKIKSDIIRSEY